MRIAIVRSSRYPELLAQMEKSARGALREAGVEGANVETTSVPGAFEIPLACRRIIEGTPEKTVATVRKPSRTAAIFESLLRLLRFSEVPEKGKTDGVIALGIIIQGETHHAAEIARACTDGLMRVQIETNVPIAHEVLFVDSMKQAEARIGRGAEAAKALLAVMECPP